MHFDVKPSPAPVGEAGPSGRRLLAALRDVMAGTMGAQDKLDRTVTLIAQALVADVCSCYVVRPGDVLELFATVGLNRDAVHRTRLRVGEGLIGEVAINARPLAISNARAHPKFAYRPETGEDPFTSMLGVPLLRGGKVRGVLAIQTAERSEFDAEIVETMETVAMLLAELVASGELGAREEVAGFEVAEPLPSRIEGVTLNTGLARGVAVLHRPRLTVRQMVGDDPEVELNRFTFALSEMHTALDDLIAKTNQRGIQVTGEILETYRMFAEDQGWLGRIREAIRSGLSAEAAVMRVQDETGARLRRIDDPYLRERLSDFDDLAGRLLRFLAGGVRTQIATLPPDPILVARSLGPAEMLEYGQEIKAVLLEEGAASSHVAILAKAFGIPMVGRLGPVTKSIEPLDPVIVDGDNGQVFVRPADDVQAVFEQNLQARALRAIRFRELSDRPPVTLDGVRIGLHMNAGLLVDLQHMHDQGAEGVGLYRTEIPFMVRSSYPDVEAQTDLYSRVFEAARGKPVTFRTLDVGGDKQLPYFRHDDGPNPALGWRAIRIGLDRPAMLRQQIRAILRAAAGRPFRLMFPMVATVEEFDQARALVRREQARLADAGGGAGGPIQIGAMVEVPSLLFQLDALLARADFLAVGTNDLFQYLFAVDRDTPELGRRFDPLSTGFLSVLQGIAARCALRGTPVSVCGEMAGRPLEALALIGLGYRVLSASPVALGPIRQMVLTTELAPVAGLIADSLAREAGNLRARLRAFAKDAGIAV